MKSLAARRAGVSPDERALLRWLEARVQATEAETWDSITEQLRFLGKWEFNGYRR